MRFKSLIRNDLREDGKKSILKRDTQSFDDSKYNGYLYLDRGILERKSKSFEDREDEYEQHGRNRAFHRGQHVQNQQQQQQHGSHICNDENPVGLNWTNNTNNESPITHNQPQQMTRMRSTGKLMKMQTVTDSRDSRTQISVMSKTHSFGYSSNSNSNSGLDVTSNATHSNKNTRAFLKQSQPQQNCERNASSMTGIERMNTTTTKWRVTASGSSSYHTQETNKQQPQHRNNKMVYLSQQSHSMDEQMHIQQRNMSKQQQQPQQQQQQQHAHGKHQQQMKTTHTHQMHYQKQQHQFQKHQQDGSIEGNYTESSTQTMGDLTGDSNEYVDGNSLAVTNTQSYEGHLPLPTLSTGNEVYVMSKDDQSSTTDECDHHHQHIYSLPSHANKTAHNGLTVTTDLVPEWGQEHTVEELKFKNQATSPNIPNDAEQDECTYVGASTESRAVPTTEAGETTTSWHQQNLPPSSMTTLPMTKVVSTLNAEAAVHIPNNTVVCSSSTTPPTNSAYEDGQCTQNNNNNNNNSNNNSNTTANNMQSSSSVKSCIPNNPNKTAIVSTTTTNKVTSWSYVPSYQTTDGSTMFHTTTMPSTNPYCNSTYQQGVS